MFQISSYARSCSPLQTIESEINEIEYKNEITCPNNKSFLQRAFCFYMSARTALDACTIVALKMPN